MKGKASQSKTKKGTSKRNQKSGPLVLVGDIGGTTTRLALADCSAARPRLILLEKSPTSHVENFPRHVKEFLARSTGHGAPAAACFGVAGIIRTRNKSRRVEMTNTKLVIDEAALARALKIPVVLLNDFSANAYALPILTKEDGVVLRKGKEEKTDDGVATRVLIGPGTGLGMAIVANDEGTPRIIMSEGGHADLPFKENQQPLREFLMRDLGTGSIVYEDALSGRGLERLYRYIRSTTLRETHLPERLSAAEISATAGRNECSTAALELFVHLLAQCARNVALDAYATGGVYVCGGVAARNPHALKEFPALFANHPSPAFRKTLGQIPLTLITNQELGLLGAAVRANQIVKRNKQ